MISRSSLTDAYPKKQLGEVVEFLDSMRRPVTESDRCAGEYPYYGANGLQGTIDDFIFDEPLVLLAEDGGHFGTADRGIAYRVSGKTWVNNHAHVLRPKACVDLGFLCRVLENYDVTPWVTGTTRGKLTQAGAAQIVVPLPPLPEQRRIAEILDKADALRAKRRAALAQLDTLTQSIFLDMFGDPATNPKGWPLKALSALGEISTGKTPPTGNEGMFGGAIPFATPGDLDGKLESTQRTITLAGAAFTKIVRPGSALVGCIGNIGKMAKTPVATAFNQQINAVEWGRDVNDDYGIAALVFAVPQMLALASSTTVPILNKTGFSKVRLPVPPLSIQRDFALRISAVGELTSTHRTALQLAESLFGALQHRAFRGEL